MMSPANNCKFLPQGALIQQFNVSDCNLVLNFPEAAMYKIYNTAYFGETIGRIANRVQNAELTNLNGRSYALAKNAGRHSLHGGLQGWGKRIFEGPSTVLRNGRECTRFTLVSEDGDEGYPGTVECQVWYSVQKDEQAVALDIEYQVTLLDDECVETVVALTNHR